MQANASKCKQMQANASKCKQMQANASKCKQMQANASKCKQMQANASKCKQMQANASAGMQECKHKQNRTNTRKSAETQAFYFYLNQQFEFAIEQHETWHEFNRRPREIGLTWLLGRVCTNDTF